MLAVVPREVGGQLAYDPGHGRRGALADSRLAEVVRELCWRGAQALGCRDAEVATVPVVDPPDELSVAVPLVYGAGAVPGAGPPCRRPGNPAGGFTGPTRHPERDRDSRSNQQAKPPGRRSATWAGGSSLTQGGLMPTVTVGQENSSDIQIH